jgi:hypothetical protein
MNCHDAVPLLDQLVRRPDDGVEVQMALREHVVSCPNCQNALRSLERWEGQLTRAMCDVVVPTGLTERLLDALNSSNSTELASAPATTQTTRKGWLRVVAAFSAVCLLFAVAFGTWNYLQPPLLTASDVIALLQVASDPLPAAEDSFRQLPQHWSSLRGMLYMDAGRHLEVRHPKLSVVVIPVEVPSKRGPSVFGSLLVIPRSRWTGSHGQSVSQARVLYSPPNVWIAWSENDVVYVLSLEGHAPLLEKIQQQLAGNHAFL